MQRMSITPPVANAPSTSSTVSNFSDVSPATNLLLNYLALQNPFLPLFLPPQLPQSPQSPQSPLVAGTLSNNPPPVKITGPVSLQSTENPQSVAELTSSLDADAGAMLILTGLRVHTGPFAIPIHAEMV